LFMTAAPLLAGVALSILGGIVRMRAWHAALVETAPHVRYRDVVVAHLGGAGFNGLVPAHGGDAVKLALLKRRVPDVRFGQLLGSLAPPAAVEALLTALLVAWALATGVLETPSTGQIPLPLVGAAAAVAAGILWLLARRAPRLLRDVRSGMAALRHPGDLVRTVVPWVLAARMFRLAAIACFLTAVGLPATLIGVLVVMAIQGSVGSGGAASAAMRIAVLAASLPGAIGVHAVSFQTAAALTGAAQVGPMVANLAISVVVLGLTLRTASPRRVLGYCRENMKAAKPAPAVTDATIS
jgi:Lysylphosphatidylglycerol synthase TM region